MLLRLGRNSQAYTKASIKILSSTSPSINNDGNNNSNNGNKYLTRRYNSTNVNQNKNNNNSGSSSKNNGNGSASNSTTANIIPTNKDLNKLQSFLDKKQLQNNGNSNRNDDPNHIVSPDSPWYNQCCAFDDCVFQSLSQTKFTPRYNSMDKSTPLFWDSLNKAMDLYAILLESPNLSAKRVSALINLLHNALRINRMQMIKLNKKPDYDSKSFNNEIVKYLINSLRMVSNDIIEKKVTINEYGIMHLLTSFKELSLEEEALNIWKIGMDDPSLREFFIHPKPVGVLLPLLFQFGKYNFTDLKSLYEQSKSTVSYDHPNLMVGMIIASLFANENKYAMDIFSKLCETCKSNQFNYLTDAHLSFIGNCKDIGIAETFFDRAINKAMPYQIRLQVSYVNDFLQNIWDADKDFSKIMLIWEKTVKFYGPRINLGVLSSLNNKFFDLFFENYLNDKIEGFKVLQKLIDDYNTIKNIDEPFLNIILSKCSKWNDKDILNYLEGNYSLFNIPQTIVTKRIMLKQLGSIDEITTKEIWDKWEQVIIKLDQMGQTYIANADWAALRDATLKWSQSNINNNIVVEERVLLYLKIVKLYKQYCRDSRQLTRIIKGFGTQYPILQTYLDQMDQLDTSDLSPPNVHNLEYNSAL